MFFEHKCVKDLLRGDPPGWTSVGRVNCLLKNSDSTGDICCPKLRVLQRVSIYFIKKINHNKIPYFINGKSISLESKKESSMNLSLNYILKS